MLPMEIDRRRFLAGGLIAAAQCALPPAVQARAHDAIAATTRMADGSHAAVIYDLKQGLLGTAALPGRGHDITVNPATGECVAFARRPGNFAVAFGHSGKRSPVRFSAPEGRHFYGHGVFAENGRLLYTTENNIASGAGVIGVWDATADYQRVGELPAFGIGPHDINLLDDDRTLVVANGGVRTHPDHGRRPLNLATMTPSLVYLDRTTGDLIERHALAPAQHKISIRHLDVGARDTVVFGCQFKGPRSQIADLVGFHRRGEELQFVKQTAVLHRALRHYVSSVAVDRNGEHCAVTSSRGQHVVVLDLTQRRVVGIHGLRDVSGIAAARLPGQFIATSGSGELAHASAGQRERLAQKPDWSWDNHAVRYDL